MNQIEVKRRSLVKRSKIFEQIFRERPDWLENVNCVVQVMPLTAKSIDWLSEFLEEGISKCRDPSFLSAYEYSEVLNFSRVYCLHDGGVPLFQILTNSLSKFDLQLQEAFVLLVHTTSLSIEKRLEDMLWLQVRCSSGWKMEEFMTSKSFLSLGLRHIKKLLQQDFATGTGGEDFVLEATLGWCINNYSSRNERSEVLYYHLLPHIRLSSISGEGTVKTLRKLLPFKFYLKVLEDKVCGTKKHLQRPKLSLLEMVEKGINCSKCRKSLTKEDLQNLFLGNKQVNGEGFFYSQSSKSCKICQHKFVWSWPDAKQVNQRVIDQLFMSN